MAFNPADNIQDLQYFGEFGGVNPSISDSSTYTFLAAKSMIDTFEGNLTTANEEHIVLEWKAREPKPIGKGNHTVQKRKEIDFSEIKQAKVILKF